jgi:bacteriocin-like protein
VFTLYPPLFETTQKLTNDALQKISGGRYSPEAVFLPC